MVLHQEPGGGAVPAFHQQEAGEAGELVVGPRQPTEEGGDYQGGALEAHATLP